MKLLFGVLFAVVPLFSELAFLDKKNEEIRIAFVTSPDEIDLKKGKEILVKSFMTAYEDVPLTDLNPAFRSTGDVRRFYENYFDEELEHYMHGGLFWVQAFKQDELVGWATFELEPGAPNEAYMNLLIVSPEHQKRGIGERLVFSIRDDQFSDLHAINLLIRKVNLSGLEFYKKIGFAEFDYQRDNFVDVSLLNGLRWEDSQ